MTQAMESDGQKTESSEGAYPRSLQVSTTEATAAAIEAAAARAKQIRKLPRMSVSLVIREALEEKFGGAAK